MFLVLVVLLSGASVAWMAASMPTLREQQTERGLFGNDAREGLIVRWTAAAVDLAEQQVRLAYFGSALRTRIWEGTVAEIVRPHSARRTMWRFTTGEVWDVKLAGVVPKAARRVVVRAVEPRGRHLLVDAYVPGRMALSLLILDARIAEDGPSAPAQ